MNLRAWQLRPQAAAAERALTNGGCGPLLARVLAGRGCTGPAQAQALLGEGAPLSDPFLMKDMDKAVARLQAAIEEEQPIVIFGDYDVDGVSATAILFEALSNLGAQVKCMLPSRDGGGYGINREVLQKLASKGYSLVVTVDNGISAVEEAGYAKELGIDLVITDHHLPPDPLPEAVAVVDPQRPDDESPFKDLCGAGVAFKLAAALEGADPAELLDMYGDLAALGTIADVMPLTGENRTLVRAVSDYLGMAFYKVYRLLYAMDDSSNKKAFAAPQSVFSELCDAEMKRCEAQLRHLAETGEDATLDMSLERVQQKWPRLAPSLLSLLHGADEKIVPGIEKN